MKATKALINAREFARRLGHGSLRTIDRLILAKPPGLPPVIVLNNRRFFEESAVDAYIKQRIEDGILATSKMTCGMAEAGGRENAVTRAKAKAQAKKAERRHAALASELKQAGAR
jgi:predicted DNA-binding transcriptional regulator AlpA